MVIAVVAVAVRGVPRLHAIPDLRYRSPACSAVMSSFLFPLSSFLFPCLALPCLALPCLALPCLALPCLALPCLALPCLALPCLASFALPCQVFQLVFPHECNEAAKAKTQKQRLQIQAFERLSVAQGAAAPQARSALIALGAPAECSEFRIDGGFMYR